MFIFYSIWINFRCPPLLYDICVSVNANVEKQKMEQLANLQVELSNIQSTNMHQDVVTQMHWWTFCYMFHIPEIHTHIPVDDKICSEKNVYYSHSDAVQTGITLQVCHLSILFLFVCFILFWNCLLLFILCLFFIWWVEFEVLDKHQKKLK